MRNYTKPDQYKGIFRQMKTDLPRLLTARQEEVAEIISELSGRPFVSTDGGWYFPPTATDTTPLMVCHADTINTHSYDFVSSKKHSWLAATQPKASAHDGLWCYEWEDDESLINSDLYEPYDLEQAYDLSLDPMDETSRLSNKMLNPFSEEALKLEGPPPKRSEIFVSQGRISLTLKSRKDFVLGADDRAGCFIAATIMAKKGYGLLLCRDEEIGSKGANMIISDTALCARIKESHNCLIEIDRRGKNHVVEYGHGEKLQDIICGMNQFWKKQNGTCSDISVLAPALDLAAVNVSAAYENEHTHNEYVDLAALASITISLSATLGKLCAYTAEQLRDDGVCSVCGKRLPIHNRLAFKGCAETFCSEECAYEMGYLKCGHCGKWCVITSENDMHDEVLCPTCGCRISVKELREEAELKKRRMTTLRQPMQSVLWEHPERGSETTASFTEAASEPENPKAYKSFWRRYLASFLG